MNVLSKLPQKINWFPGHMRKALNTLQQKMSIVDVFIQIRDARIPYSSRNPQLQSIVKKAQKQKLIIFNKYDLCDPNKTDKIIKDYNDYGIQCFKVSTYTHDDMRKIIGVLKQRYSRKYDMVGLWFMIMGMPNVGKSTLINQIRSISDLQNKRAAAKATASVATTKGVNCFKMLQNPIMWLVDSPGVMIPSNLPPQAGLKMASVGLVKENIVDKSVIIQFLYQYFAKQNDSRFYKALQIQKPDNLQDFFDKVRYRFKKHNDDANFDYILQNFRQGKLGKITLDEPIEVS